MSDYTAFVTDIESMADPDRAKALDELNALWCETEGRFLDFIHCAMPLGGSPHPLTCRGARLIVKPFPENLDRGTPTERTDEAEEHIGTCDICKKWDEAGRPHSFDMTWNADRDAFCSCIRIALHHREDWPKSYAVALRHTEYCKACREWQDHITASSSCEATRALLRKNDRRLAYFVLPQPNSATDGHVAACTSCQEWCATSVTCEEAHESVRGVVGGNESDWKVYRHDTLAPRERYHLMRCPDCRNWVEENIERGIASAPVFDAMEGKTANEESHRWASDLQHSIRGLMTGLLSASGQDEPSWAREIAVDDRGKDTPISEVGFSIRTTNCLTKAGYSSIGELLGKCDEELRSIRNLGRKCVLEIRHYLRAYGLQDGGNEV